MYRPPIQFTEHLQVRCSRRWTIGDLCELLTDIMIHHYSGITALVCGHTALGDELCESYDGV